tara:strand:+ start:273 stop:509 length:237 start_codon:yes stop_codon:yes gene_type:complete
MEDSLSRQLQKLFQDIEEIQVLGKQLSLNMFIEDATDETTAVFTDLMMLIKEIKIPELEYVFEDVTSVITNKEEIARA